ncbi:heterokaryon incompatibility protein-domain-containing protein [Stachybotrys elegans]|uniref:Heterokaryon incompatibility protein-domain-containing protein n=1 Tax=Stachybotrys elegans TaxID=80388 RepID=A0A8K0SC16_9HYPO|nr:heterokaryon incompatibility protein-domain-containing protein [Stachybotrys elegans]
MAIKGPGEVLIHLLHLQPGQTSDPIVCETQQVPLSSDVPYETLSYCWGNLPLEMSILQDGSPKAITLSLSMALRQIRNPNKARTLWVDQLCIDQSNETEKSRQVSVMQDIYRKSANGISWLGELPTELDKPGLGQVILAMMGSPRAKWQGVRWWQRIWTVQEAKLPRASIIQWGQFVISFDIIKRIALKMTQSWDFCQRFNHVFDLGWLLNHFCTPLANLQIHDTTGVLGSLYRWRYRETSEPRDKVFALMGLFPGIPFPSVPFCDYSLSVVDIYKLVTLDLIRQNRGLLPLVGRRGEPRATPNLPSWVLDWMPPKNPAKRSHDYFGNCRRWEFFDCSGGTYVDPVISDSNGLVLQGCKVDEIALVGPVRFVDHRTLTEDEYDNKAREIAGDFRTVFEAWLRTQEPGISYVRSNSVTPLEAFRRTLIGDLVLDGYESDHRASFDEAVSVDAQIDGENLVVHNSLRDMVCSQSFFITRHGYTGIGPPDARIGDEVWVLLCGNFPHVLRPLMTVGATHSDEEGYEHVGDAYVHGIMDGEVIRDDTFYINKVIIY